MKKTKAKTIPTHTLPHYLFTLLFGTLKSFAKAIVWLLLAFVGFAILISNISPYHLIVGLPLIGLSLGLFINIIFGDLFNLFKIQYNKSVCPLCS